MGSCTAGSFNTVFLLANATVRLWAYRSLYNDLLKCRLGVDGYFKRWSPRNGMPLITAPSAPLLRPCPAELVWRSDQSVNVNQTEQTTQIEHD